MPGADLGLISMPRQVVDLQAQLRRVRAGMTGGGGFDPNADPVVIGNGANAEGGIESVIIGMNADNFGGDGFCVAIGWAATVSAYAGTAVGPDSNARGQYSIALGNSPAAQGTDDVCIGRGGSTARSTSTAGRRNIAIGKFALTSFAYPAAAASDCIAIGSFAEADANAAIAIGNGAYAGHVASTAIGSNAATTADNQTMLGSTNGFVEIPGDSSTAPNGLVLTDTADGTRYIMQITSGAVVLNAAP